MSESTSCSLHHLDSFSAAAFFGNPAAVVVVPPDRELPRSTMVAVAAELGLSETAFVSPDGPPGRFKLRWFTPKVEVALCGHGTLAAAKALRLEGERAEPLRFLTLSGELCVSGGCGDAPLAMAFPFNVAAPRHDALVKALWSALLGDGSELADAVDSMFYSPATRKLVVRLRDATPASLLAAWVPDPAAALRVDQGDEPEASRVTGVSVTLRAAPADPAAPPLQVVAFYSRYFSPWNGIPEDPVNGSSHTILGPLWADVLGAWGPPLPASAETAAGVPGGLPEGPATDAGADLVHSRARLRAVQLSARGGTLDLLCVRAGLRRGRCGSGESDRGDCVDVVPALSRVVISGDVAPVYSGTIRL